VTGPSGGTGTATVSEPATPARRCPRARVADASRADYDRAVKPMRDNATGLGSRRALGPCAAARNHQPGEGTMAVILGGFAASNYFNKVKLALLEKQIPFTEELAMPSQDPAFIDVSPRGKVPFLRIGSSTLCESQVIVEYLEDAYPAIPLYPADPLERARCRELIQILELHVELVARRLYPAALFGLPMQDNLKDQVASELTLGIAALKRRVRFAPFIAGERLTYADVAAAFHLPLAGLAIRKTYNEDRLADIPGIPDYLAMMYARPHVAAVDAKRRENTPQFIAAIRKRYGLA
jgi:glutathione S-transferase